MACRTEYALYSDSRVQTELIVHCTVIAANGQNRVCIIQKWPLACRSECALYSDANWRADLKVHYTVMAAVGENLVGIILCWQPPTGRTECAL